MNYRRQKPPLEPIPDSMMELAAALISLAESNIPPDIQELLVQGDPMRDIPPGALAKALHAASVQCPAAEDDPSEEQINAEMRAYVSQD